MTFVANAVLTAAQLNTHLRDNLNETAPGKATSANGLIVTTGANAIVQRTPTADAVGTGESTASTSFTNLATSGPAVTVTTGTAAIVVVSARITNSSASQGALMAYDVSGATTIAGNDDRGLWAESSGTAEFMRASAVVYQTGLTAGSNTFTAKYRVIAGTGTFAYREILVIPL